MTATAKQTRPNHSGAPGLCQSASTVNGTCQAAQARLLSSAVAVNEKRLASSGTSSARQPSSSPSVAQAVVSTPQVAKYKAAAACGAGDGSVNGA